MKKQKQTNPKQACFNLQQFLLYLFIFLLPTQLGKHFFFHFSYVSGVRTDYLAPTIYLTDILAIIIITANISAVFRFLLRKEVVIFSGLILANLLFSQSTTISIIKSLKIYEFLLIALIYSQSSLSLRKISLFLLLGAGFELLLTTTQFVTGHSLQGFWYWLGERRFGLSTPGIAKIFISNAEYIRPYGTFSHPNSLAGFYLLVYFFALTSKVVNNNLLKYSLLFISACLVLISFSKVAISALVFFNIAYLIFQKNKTCRFCVFARSIVFLTIGLLFLNTQGDPLTLQKRVELLKNSLVIFLQHPFFGVGMGNYLNAQKDFFSHYPFFFNQPVHNIVLLFMTEAGLLLGLYSLAVLIKTVLRNISLSLLYCILVVLATGMFDHYWITLQQNILLMGVFSGILINKRKRS